MWKIIPFKYVINCRRTLEMPLINCKIDLLLNLCAQWVISFNIGINQTRNYWYKITENYWQLSDSYWYKSKCAIINTKLYVPIVNLSTQDIYKAITTIKIRFQKKTTRKDINQKKKNKLKTCFRLLNWSKFSRCK